MSCGVKQFLTRLEELPLEEIFQRLKEAESLITGWEAGYTFQFGGGLKIEQAELNYLNEAEEKKLGGLESLYLQFVKKNAIMIGSDVLLKEDIGCCLKQL